jgi:hypothetical protein
MVNNLPKTKIMLDIYNFILYGGFINGATHKP